MRPLTNWSPLAQNTQNKAYHSSVREGWGVGVVSASSHLAHSNFDKFNRVEHP